MLTFAVANRESHMDLAVEEQKKAGVWGSLPVFQTSPIPIAYGHKFVSPRVAQKCLFGPRAGLVKAAECWRKKHSHAARSSAT